MNPMRRSLGSPLLFAVVAACGLCNCELNAETQLPRVFVLDAAKLATEKQKVQSGDTNALATLARLEREAKELLAARATSVMDKTQTPPSGNRHDYMSMAPYFWPNPNSTNGLPYVRRDGERNPEINRIPDHGNILAMPERVETLARAFYFTGNEQYAAKAAEFLRVWFLDPATRMNPHFRYAQAIRGVNTGRGIGLIESRGLIHVVDGVGLLAGSKSWTESDDHALREWFEQFLEWMLTSDHGRDEAAARNNHGTYYDIQTASFAFYLGKLELATNILTEVKSKRITVQIEPDGREPLELVRTRAWSYSTANLSGLMTLARLGENVGLDLWNYQTVDGRSIGEALDYLTPFVFGDKKWPHQQLGGFNGSSLFPLIRRMAEKSADPKYKELQERIPETNRRDRRQQEPVQSEENSHNE